MRWPGEITVAFTTNPLSAVMLGNGLKPTTGAFASAAGHRETETERERQRETKRDREIERQRDREIERKLELEIERSRFRDTES